MNFAHRVLSAASGLAVQGLSAACGSRLSILIFHRVLPQLDAIFPAELDAARFDELMALVARSFQVLPLSEAVQRLDQRTLPGRALCITFDDGYADNHDVALPILQRYGLPACFFIATGFLDGGRMFNDTVIESVRRSRQPLIDLGDFGLGRHDLQTPAQRAAAIAQVLSLVKYMGLEERPRALEQLHRICRPHALPDDLMMTRHQVRAMHAAGMEIGAHTVHHPILSRVDDQVAEREMVESRELLQGLIDQPVSLFAYPNGQPDRDYALRHAEMAKRLGFAAAVSTAAGVSGPGDDRYQLPRFTPWDRSSGAWMARLVACRHSRSFRRAGPVSG